MKRDAIQDVARIVVEPNWLNKTLFLGDNLHMMRWMNSGPMDLIHLDLPFNRNRKYLVIIGHEEKMEGFIGLARNRRRLRRARTAAPKHSPLFIPRNHGGTGNPRRADVFLLADDVVSVDRNETTFEGNRIHLFALRSNSIALLEDSHGRHLRMEKLSE